MLSEEPPFEVTGTNAEATTETGEPNHAGSDGGASVWYRWTPSTDGLARIATCRSDFDTLLGVYTGPAVDALTEVASDDDGCAPTTRGSVAVLVVDAGTTYNIAVDGFRGDTGTIALTIVGAAANDDFADAQALDGPLPIEVLGTNLNSSAEPGEPNHDNFSLGGPSVWYRWTADASAPVTFEVCGNDFDSVLGVYTGSRVDQLTQVALNDESLCGISPFTGSRVTFAAVAGETYQVAVDGFFLDEGFFRLRIPRRPDNDNFAAAQDLSGPLPLNATGTNLDATKEPGEPNHAGGPGGASVWYRWTASASGPVAIDTCASDFDTLLGVYTGTALEDLSAVASNDDGCASGEDGSEVSFTATAGTTYTIAVDGFPDLAGDGTGSIALSIQEPGSSLPPAPVLSGTDPPSPANDNSPRVLGQARAGTTVRLYRNDPTCTGPADATGSAAELGGAGIEVGVRDDATTTIRARAVTGDAASACSEPIAYVEDSTPPGPARCGGRRVTIRGTDGGEVIMGTNRRDVIAARGGADRIRGRRGYDVLCGGRGADVLIGGPGRDRLLGGPGNDVERQGKGGR